MTSAEQAVGEPIAKAFNPNAKLPTHEDVYNAIEPNVETALGLVTPGKVKPLPTPAAPTAGPFGLTLSEGEAAGDLAARQAEQQFIRQGTPHGQEWTAQRQAQLAAAKDRIAAGFDPFGQQIAETPNEAGSLLQQGLQRTAAARKAAVDTAYAQARSMPGEIHASVFQDMPAGIKNDLSQGTSPVIVDDKLTPYASQMIRDIDNRVGNLNIQNRVGQPIPIDPLTGKPMPIMGVNLDGVDQMRKRLSTFRGDAFKSGNGADGRAAKAVLDAFDDRIDQAVNGGLFNGNPDAVQAWNNARAAHSDYKSDFSGGKNDPAGKVVEKILGKYTNNPMAPDDVARYFTGGQGITSNSLNVNVANKMKGILGEQSPEWIGVKQGAFSNMVEKPPGMTDWGPGQIANRLSKFANSDLGRAVYTPGDLNLVNQYANLMRQITMPPGSYFPSAPAINKVVNAVGGKLGTMAAAAIGGRLVPIPFVGEMLGAGTAMGINKAAQNINAAQLAKQLPLVANQMKQWQRAVSKAQNPARGRQSAAAAATTNALINSLSRLGIDGHAFLPPLRGTIKHNSKTFQGHHPSRKTAVQYASKPLPKAALPNPPRHKRITEAGRLPNNALNVRCFVHRTTARLSAEVSARGASVTTLSGRFSIRQRSVPGLRRTAIITFLTLPDPVNI